ncbi:Short-chain dehydrogenase/reductase family 16C member 6 [Araneus ventricosus]|uniref:Short-chain dehydrogenase/reductase family 16C member 6 n=2 Tax=Araneus ventricosus TaxID=182803 RepID=A0A4Y2UFE1_ARAVE|nr:Short-chain dehydrogenase/reductase family 16C member 6 [Araneus ventricosus]
MKIPKEFEVFLAVMSGFHLMLSGYIVGLITLLIPSRFQRKRRKDISGQIVLVTGAGNGIGRLLAVEFSKLRAVVVLIDINKNGMNETKNLMNPMAKAFVYECDVSNRQKVYEVAKRIRAEVGKVDILVNNAGIVNGKRFLELSDDSIERIMQINTMAHFWKVGNHVNGISCT